MTCQKSRDDIMIGQQQSALFIDNQLWSIKRLARYLDIPIATIRDWCHKRQIPFVKVGRHVRFHPPDVQEWLAERSIKNGYPKT